jgi:hypothetical protein
VSRFEPDYSGTIRAGRAYVRLIESARVLIAWEEDERSRRRLELVRRRARERLRAVGLPVQVQLDNAQLVSLSGGL